MATQYGEVMFNIGVKQGCPLHYLASILMNLKHIWMRMMEILCVYTTYWCHSFLC